MKAIYRLAGPDQYFYLELEDEVASSEQAIENYNRAVSAYKALQEGLDPKEWRQCLVRYVESSQMDSDCHERMNKAQKWWVSELDRTFEAIKYKNK